MGSHFHNRIDYNGVVPLIEYLKWGHIFTIWGGQKIQVGRDLKMRRFLLY